MTIQAGKWDNANDVRQAFIDFFVQKKAHKFIKSSPVVPHNDPTLLFINAGMNQFKGVLLGRVDQNHPFYGLKRAANSQKCIRAGGKHNDLEDVGRDTYHHTFFEMLGNWSFGDYFKKDAIAWSWELLTDVYGLDPSRIYVTYYGGDPKEPNVPVDEEARTEWLRYLPESQVLPFGMKENFWEMGDTGPCGPCSEIHYDRIGGRNAAHLVNQDDPDVLEIWNNVFMQFNREKDRSLTKLPAPSVDTGMGFERLSSVLKGVRSNYDIDLFQHIFAAIKKECPAETPAYGGQLHNDIDIAYRVVADHIRTLTVALSDGAVPSNQDRGYVLRRILRRAVRYGKEVLNAKPGFFGRLVDAVDETLGGTFPEIRRNKEDVRAILHEEESQFGRTLDRGIREFKARAEKASQAGTSVMSGKDAFLLYTTYGFPLDLTQLMAREKNMTVDENGFNFEMEAFKNKSRDGSNFSMDSGLVLGAEQAHYLSEVQKIVPTDDSLKYNWDPSTGTSSGQFPVTVHAIWGGKVWLDAIDETTGPVGLVLDKTPFYAEAGGQVFDIGMIEGKNFEFNVTDVQKFGQYILHIGSVVSGSIARGVEGLSAQVDYSRRALIAKNHTGTHVLNFALREVLGDKVDQKGSFVDESKLRFDFSWPKPVEIDELIKIESIVNSIVGKHLGVNAKNVALADGKRINSLRVVPGETYPDPVRVVAVGQTVEGLIQAGPETTYANSVEFCGGTHLTNTKDIHKMLILSEEGVQKGVRRIVAVTGAQATVEAILKAKAFQQEVEEAAQTKGDLLAQSIASLRQRLGQDKEISLTEKRQMLADIDKLKEELIRQEKEAAKELLKTAATLGTSLELTPGKKFQVLAVPQLCGDAKAMGACIDGLSGRDQRGFCLVSASSSTLAVIAVVPKELSSEVSAKAWVDAVLAAVNGRGGGNPLKAQGQSQETDKMNDAVTIATNFVSSKN